MKRNIIEWTSKSQEEEPITHKKKEFKKDVDEPEGDIPPTKDVKEKSDIPPTENLPPFPRESEKTIFRKEEIKGLPLKKQKKDIEEKEPQKNHFLIAFIIVIILIISIITALYLAGVVIIFIYVWFQDPYVNKKGFLSRLGYSSLYSLLSFGYLPYRYFYGY